MRKRKLSGYIHIRNSKHFSSHCLFIKWSYDWKHEISMSCAVNFWLTGPHIWKKIYLLSGGLFVSIKDNDGQGTFIISTAASGM